MSPFYKDKRIRKIQLDCNFLFNEHNAGRISTEQLFNQLKQKIEEIRIQKNENDN